MGRERSSGGIGEEGPGVAVAGASGDGEIEGCARGDGGGEGRDEEALSDDHRGGGAVAEGVGGLDEDRDVGDGAGVEGACGGDGAGAAGVLEDAERKACARASCSGERGMTQRRQAEGVGGEGDAACDVEDGGGGGAVLVGDEDDVVDVWSAPCDVGAGERADVRAGGAREERKGVRGTSAGGEEREGATGRQSMARGREGERAADGDADVGGVAEGVLDDDVVVGVARGSGEIGAGGGVDGGAGGVSGEGEDVAAAGASSDGEVDAFEGGDEGSERSEGEAGADADARLGDVAVVVDDAEGVGNVALGARGVEAGRGV